MSCVCSSGWGVGRGGDWSMKWGVGGTSGMSWGFSLQMVHRDRDFVWLTLASPEPALSVVRGMFVG